MTEPSMLAKALIAVFLVSLLALLAEILFVVWRRRVSHQQDLSLTASDHDHGGTIFCCSKTQSRVEPITGGSDEAYEVQDDSVDALKLRDMSRLLFTIREEEEEGKEDLESQKSVSSATSICERKYLSNGFEGTATLSELVLTIDDENDDNFSTPCASPSYFSPFASPSHSGHS
ncbi:hypothetical protein DCAR_0519349 [Daucus carota subsp. sativus]|uniref:Uncharacterized protein n=1 Tax=Daucus carota subsp. sativus TaxID=79200 RepID=A0A164XWZ0_DAUCS|nr:hypothetical protein DCAR_0519349 [Daucus carota subsp. sativus]